MPKLSNGSLIVSSHSPFTQVHFSKTRTLTQLSLSFYMGTPQRGFLHAIFSDVSALSIPLLTNEKSDAKEKGKIRVTFGSNAGTRIPFMDFREAQFQNWIITQMLDHTFYQLMLKFYTSRCFLRLTFPTLLLSKSEINSQRTEKDVNLIFCYKLHSYFCFPD